MKSTALYRWLLRVRFLIVRVDSQDFHPLAIVEVALTVSEGSFQEFINLIYQLIAALVQGTKETCERSTHLPLVHLLTYISQPPPNLVTFYQPRIILVKALKSL